MPSSIEANRPRWRGQPGFFEIWFLVVFDPSQRRAWWLRYTTFAPRVGPARATVWAAAFDAAGGRSFAGKRVVPVSAYDGGGRDGFGLRIDGAELGHGVCRGAIEAGGRRLAWDLTFAPAGYAAERGPRWLDRVPSPTHVAHAHAEVSCDGQVTLDAERMVLSGAVGTQKHIWGTRRVEELYWIYCPRFPEEPGGAFEASSVRVRAGRPPRLAPVWLQADGHEHAWWGMPGLLRHRVVPVAPGHLRAAARVGGRRIVADARCDPASLVGYVYRDPAGWDVHVAQSDVATCTVEVQSRSHRFASWTTRLRRTAPMAAVEFHHPDPLPGVRYVPWDAASV